MRFASLIEGRLRRRSRWRSEVWRPAAAARNRSVREGISAIGRDYADVAPIDGVIYTSGGQRLEVSVSVTPVG